MCSGEKKSLPVRRGMPKWVGGFYDQVESPMYATAVGLLVTAARRERQSAAAGTGLPGMGDGLPGVGRAVRRVREWVTALF